MFFIEVFLPRGALEPDRRSLLMRRLGSLSELLEDESMHPDAERSFREGYQTVLHEPEEWIIGGDAWRPGDAPRYVVRAHVPGPWRKEMAEHLIPIFLRVLGEVDGDPATLTSLPRAWVYIIGVTEGAIGAFGRPMTSEALADHIGSGYREAQSRGEADPLDGPEPGSVYDPHCGAPIRLAEAEYTWDNEGRRYAFCCPACRKSFQEKVVQDAV